jgi:hypothetical protein
MGERRAIGRFRIEGEAASGAAGTVYRAIDPENGERVAIKVVRGVADVDAVRFEREAAILARLLHPGVVRYVAHGRTEEDEPWLAMEWLEGEDLRQRLARAPLTVRECVTLGRRVAEALGAIHEQRLLHRDIKPGNIFLCGGEVAQAKLVDFGLVRFEEASIVLTSTGIIVGTPSYMAPEQARGQREIDGRADLFSLGCVLYRCLAGRAPFEADSVVAVLTKVLLEEPPPLRALRPNVPSELDRLVRRLLRKEPEHRPSTALEVANALDAIEQAAEDDPDSDEVPASSVMSGLTGDERRVMSVLLVSADRGALREDATLDGKAPPSAEPSVRSVIEAHGGRLDEVQGGTRVVTLMGSGPAIDQAACAARCALALRDILPRAVMAIATGRGEVLRRRPAGEAIERAAALLGERAEAAAAARESGEPPPPAIAIDDVTAALLEGRYVIEEHAAGKSLTGARRSEAPGRAPLGTAVPMVGREWEMASIEAIFRACVEEREARALLVTGAAGMGKSRLAHEVVGALRERFPEVEIWRGRGDPLRAGSPFSLLGQIVRDASGVQPGDAPELRRERLATRVRARVAAEDAARVAALLGEIADVPFPDESSTLRGARLDPRVLQREVAAAWEELVAGTQAARPLALVLEDLQWADAATVRLLGQALQRLDRRPWLVLALARPEVHDVFPRLWEGRSLQEIRLKPLTRRASERLARLALGDRASPETIERVAARSEGNAFYLEELVRAVADGRKSASDLPDTVLGMVEERLEALDGGTRRALRAASVFGASFCEAGVAALLGTSSLEPGWAAALVEREMIVARPGHAFAGEPELAFRHGLLHAGVYATLTEVDRALGHRLAAEWLEQRGGTDPMVLARHYEIALDDARASRFYLEAAARALRSADADAAIERGGRALARASTEAQRLACLGLLVEARAWNEDWSRVLPEAHDLLQLAEPGTPPWLMALATKQTAALQLGRPEDLRSTIAALTTIEPAPGARPVLVLALAISVLQLCQAAQLPMAASVADHARAVLAGATEPLSPASVLLARSWVAAWQEGDAWSALHLAREARARADEGRDTHLARFARVYVGMDLWSLGSLAEAVAELSAVAAGGGEDLIGMRATLFLALALIEEGSLDRARKLAQRRLESARDGSGPPRVIREAEARWLLGEIAARDGAPEAAERELSASVEAMRPAALSWMAAAARLVEVRLARGRVIDALSLARELGEVHAASGGHGLRGTLVRLACAEAMLAAGEDEPARKAIRDAHEELILRAERIEDDAARARFLAEVPENARLIALAAELGVAG